MLGEPRFYRVIIYIHYVCGFTLFTGLPEHFHIKGDSRCGLVTQYVFVVSEGTPLVHLATCPDDFI